MGAEGPSPSSATRLNKFLARAGIASRRRVEAAIRAGRVRINGVVETSPARRVVPGDEVTFDGSPVNQPARVVALLNKPSGYECSMAPSGRHAGIAGLMRGLPTGTTTVGRLDVDTSGALILSNWGDLVHRLMHPRWEVRRRYRLHLLEGASEDILQRILAGVALDASTVCRPVAAEILFPDTIDVVLTTGRNREVRRLAEALSLELNHLERVSYGNLSTEGLPLGSWRLVEGDELRELLALVELTYRPA